jgi:hypothetical protein
MGAQPGIHRLMGVTRRIGSIIAARSSIIALAIALVLPLGWVAREAWLGHQGIHSPGPVAPVHERFDCKDCHARPWQPIGDLIAADQKRAYAAMDQACVRCHQGLVHHREEIPDDVPNCVGCHREHRGAVALSAISDGSCTTCHADLRTVTGPSTHYSRHVTDFASHPEFAVLRQGQSDSARIRFNHAKHLPQSGLPGPDGKPVALKCASCHQPTPDGRYMKPIAFQAHCASCHSNALVYDMARFRDLGVIHGLQPELVRGLVRERYTQFIHQNPAALKGDEAARVHPIPGRPIRRPAIEAEWAWVGPQVENADRILFRSLSGCRYCHNVVDANGTCQISPTDIPQRWFSHSQFSHFIHRLSPNRPGGREATTTGENCTACHEFARQSTTTNDVLMPSIGKCRECHAPESNPRDRARIDCVACHVYHNEVTGRRLSKAG